MSEIDSQTIPFARDTMIPPAPPPIREAGAVKWLRENFLSGPLNIALSLLSILVLWLALKDNLPWARRGIWNARSLTECRAIRDQLYGPGVEAACWAVIPDRWLQLLYGFYPRSQYWRPPLALALFLLGASPVLFPAAPRRLVRADRRRPRAGRGTWIPARGGTLPTPRSPPVAWPSPAVRRHRC